MTRKCPNRCVMIDFFQENKSHGAAQITLMLCQYVELTILSRTITNGIQWKNEEGWKSEVYNNNNNHYHNNRDGQ
jgi:hypothetical protein